jgi:hypothetical protein
MHGPRVFGQDLNYKYHANQNREMLQASVCFEFPAYCRLITMYASHL